MKGYYLFFGSNSLGVHKKVEMQVRELNRFFETICINVKLNKRNIIHKIQSRLLWHSWGFDYEKVKKKIVSPDYIYIRRVTADAGFIKFLADIKFNFPNCKIIEEIYTYPYDIDDYKRNIIHSIKQMPFYIKDRYYRTYLKKYVDRFVTFSKDERIFGVPTIITTNGIDTDMVIPKKSRTWSADTISLISVANMKVHHGYERLIKGIRIYYDNGGKRNIIYHVVGRGSELKNYQKLVKRLKLDRHVIFYGEKTGKQLDDLYDKADIGISSLGLYKYKIECISTIKICEYLAKGLPVIAGCDISTLGGGLPDFIYRFENNNTAIDINNLVKFYDFLYKEKDYNNVIDLIATYAKDNFSMQRVMQPIVEYIRKG